MPHQVENKQAIDWEPSVKTGKTQALLYVNTLQISICQNCQTEWNFFNRAASQEDWLGRLCQGHPRTRNISKYLLHLLLKFFIGSSSCQQAWSRVKRLLPCSRTNRSDSSTRGSSCCKQRTTAQTVPCNKEPQSHLLSRSVKCPAMSSSGSRHHQT